MSLQDAFASDKRVVFSHDAPLDAKQDHGSSAHRAWAQRRVHGGRLELFRGQAPDQFEAVGFAMSCRRPELDSTVAPDANDGAVFFDEGSTDRDAAFVQAYLRLHDTLSGDMYTMER